MDSKKYIITHNIISIPPHISTTWSQIAWLHKKDDYLLISLKDSDTVSIPGLTEEEMNEIFACHAKYLEKGQKPESTEAASPFSPKAMAAFIDPSTPSEQVFRIGLGSMEEMGTMMQHNIEHKNAPDLPNELVDKIAGVIKMIAPQDPDMLPRAEPHCNCMHCQIARAIGNEGYSAYDGDPIVEDDEEEVSEEELHFSQWDIVDQGENLFKVTDKLSPQETYTVFLGKPVGCTCGKSGCEHIIAVLNS